MIFPEAAESSKRRSLSPLALALASSCGLSVLPAHAATNYEVLVAPRDSAAYAAAAAKVDDATVFAERKIHAAFGRAQQLLAGCGDCTVHVKIAAGTYDGKAGTGQWSFPDVQAPRATLRILGGYSDDFSSRAPFTRPTILKVSEKRSSAVLSFEGKKHALRELVVSGLTIDTSPSNTYGAQENSLHKAGSSSFPQIAFGYLITDLLVISDNVFMNAPNGVGGPLIRAMSPKAEVRVENNFFVNNVYTWVVGSGGGSNIPGRYQITGNSFVLNWPYNPDKTTSNPGAVEIGNNHSAGRVEIRGNLFAYNAGGAVFPQWDDNRGPRIAFVDNLFWKNGGLFGAPSPGSGAVVGKFNGSATHGVFDMMDVEDNFSWETAGNVSTDPGLAIVPPKLQGIAYAGTARRGAPGAGKPAGDTAQGDAAPDDAPATADVDDLDRMMAELEALADGGEAPADSAAEAEDPAAKPAPEASASGAPSLDFDDYADEGAIKNYAPYLEYTPGKLPVPTRSEAEAYGASPERVRQY